MLIIGILYLPLVISCKDEAPAITPGIPDSTAPDYSAIPKFSWPLASPLNDGNMLINYFDTNPGTGFKDYGCGVQHGYDGHLGVDIAIPSFWHMDQGMAVVASAPGLVIDKDVVHNDRIYWTPYTTPGNYVTIEYPDGSKTIYYHLRKYSVTVEIGETVSVGQIIGYVGSSGATPFPHLHMETKFKHKDGSFESIDPFNGNCSSVSKESTWENQPIYIAEQPLLILDMGTFTEFEQYEGEFQFPELKLLKDRPTSPAVYGIELEKLGFWVQFQGNFGDGYTLKVIKPEGEIFREEEFSLGQKRRYGWHAMNWSLEGVSSSDFGIWKIELYLDGQLERTFDFEIGDQTEYGPRFYPLAGSSAVVGVNTMLNIPVVGDESVLNYEIDDSSIGLAIEGNRLTIPSSSSQQFRNHWVNIKAIDSKGRFDIFKLHLIDYSKTMR